MATMKLAIMLAVVAVCVNAATMKYDDKRCVDEDGNPLNEKLFALPEHCTHKFYQCSNGYRVTQTCPDKLVFNAVSNQCDWWSNTPGCGAPDTPADEPVVTEDKAAEVVEEQVEQAVVNTEDCVDENGALITGFAFAVPDDCNTFYQCSNGLRYQKTCPDGLVFNPDMAVCDWPYNVPGC